MIKLLFYICIIYLVYKLVFDFIMPVSKATAHVKSQMRTMQEEMNAQQARQQTTNSPNNSTRKPANNNDSEYIDFEEIK